MTALFAWERISARADHAIVAQIPARIAAGPVAARALVVRANATTLRVVVAAGAGVLAAGARASLALELDEPVAVRGTITSVRSAPAGTAAAPRAVVEIALDPLSLAAEDRLFDALCEHALPRIVDALVAPWSPPAPAPAAADERGPSLTGVYYLPVETNVL
jgi:hypothetical protein